MKFVNHNNEVCIFDESKHTYTLSDGVILPSVTGYLKKYFKEFDSDSIAAKYAIKNNLVKEDVLKMWEDKGAKASLFGTACHKYAEENLILLSNMSEPVQPSNLFEKAILQKVIDINFLYDIIGQEEILFSRKLNIAGTTDLLLGMHDTLYITDWKTNREIKTQNKFQNALGILYTFPDCEKTKYTAQLNMYLKIILTENYFPQYTKYQLILFHVTEKDVVEIRLPIYQKHVFERL